MQLGINSETVITFCTTHCVKLQMHNNKLVPFHIYNKNDYGYLLDQGPINSIQLDDKLCLCNFQQSKWKKVSLKVPITPKIFLARNKSFYYMANPVLGKSLCSDWFFLGQDFAVRTVSTETVQPVYFCFGAKPANSKFATKTAKKKLWILSFFTGKLPEEAKKIEIFPKFQILNCPE